MAILNRCGCSLFPKTITSKNTRTSINSSPRSWAVIKCSCGMKTETCWANDVLSAELQAIQIWNKGIKGTVENIEK